MNALAKKVAGTYVPDESDKLPRTLRWATNECRKGSLSHYVSEFCRKQTEPLDPSLVLVEQLTDDGIQCRVTCRCSDHETASTFAVDVRFHLNPASGEVTRIG